MSRLAINIKSFAKCHYTFLNVMTFYNISDIAPPPLSAPSPLCLLERCHASYDENKVLIDNCQWQISCHISWHCRARGKKLYPRGYIQNLSLEFMDISGYQSRFSYGHPLLTQLSLNLFEAGSCVGPYSVCPFIVEYVSFCITEFYDSYTTCWHVRWKRDRGDVRFWQRGVCPKVITCCQLTLRSLSHGSAPGWGNTLAGP